MNGGCIDVSTPNVGSESAGARTLRPTEGRKPPGHARRLRVVVAALLLAQLAPIWAFDYFPSQDGPAHLHNARVIRQAGESAPSAYREYYELRLQPVPNLLGHGVLAGLMTVASPRVAEKLLLSLIVLLFPVSIIYALRTLRPEPGFAWLLPFPLVYNFPLHMGFYSFSLGVPLSVFAIGYVSAHRAHFDLRHAAVLGPVLALAYFAHLLTLALALIAVGIIAVSRLRDAVRPAEGRPGPSGPIGNALWPLVATVPAGILAASHVLRGHFVAWIVAVGGLLGLCGFVALAARLAGAEGPVGRPIRAVLASRAILPLTAGLPALLVFALVEADAAVLGGVAPGPGTIARLQNILGADALVSFRSEETAVAIAFGATLAVLGVHAAATALLDRRRTSAGHEFGWVAVCFVALYFVSPNGVLGGGYVLPRLGLYALIAGILWVGAHGGAVASRWAAGSVAVALAGGLLVLRIASYDTLDRQLRAFVAAGSAVEANSTLLALSYAPYGIAVDGTTPSVRVKPFAHAGGYLAARKDLVLLNNYETTAGYFPVRFRPRLDPRRHLGNALRPWDHVVNLLSYARRTGGSIDFVLVWGADRSSADPAVTTTLTQLRVSGYERVGRSRRLPAGLYRRPGT